MTRADTLMTVRMHDDEVSIDDGTLRKLVDDQFPQWRSMPIRRVAGSGTVNAIFRIGEDHAARLPLTGDDPDAAAETLRREAAALAAFAGASPFSAPRPVALGQPGAGYPLPWSVQTWIPGIVATPDAVSHSPEFATDLATLIRAVRATDTGGRGFSGVGRGGNLQDADEWMDLCFTKSTGLLPVDDLRALWEELRELPDPGALAMTHGDLIPGNLLIENGRLVGVLDGGAFGPADPSLDLVAAWHLLEADARAVLRADLGSDDLEWNRGRAWAFQQAMGLVWYYADSNPTMSALGRSTLRRILDEDEMGD
ncbi:hypothetical protein SRABI121_00972 [Microbacterium sp. Bi121]|nr:hypothetical protein SRABI121_00972 [Microbacterium sp. Bi121]